jgi:hypothetical protein
VVSDATEDIGDIEPDDVHDPDDEHIDWSKVDEVQAQIDEINAIENEDIRTAAAAEWAKELAGEQ